jgi:hypothetical protein
MGRDMGERQERSRAVRPPQLPLLDIREEAYTEELFMNRIEYHASKDVPVASNDEEAEIAERLARDHVPHLSAAQAARALELSLKGLAQETERWNPPGAWFYHAILGELHADPKIHDLFFSNATQRELIRLSTLIADRAITVADDIDIDGDPLEIDSPAGRLLNFLKVASWLRTGALREAKSPLEDLDGPSREQ